VKAEIIAIGTELLLGEINDTNASYLARQLPLLGIDLYWITLVGDNRERLAEIFDQAWKRSDLILATGGLGPTEDDITREAIAGMLGEEPQVAPALEQELRAIFARMGAIPNPRGTAPGWWVEREGKIIVAMPGPPWELRRMWEEEAMPRLRQRLKGEVIVSRTLKSFGLSEAKVDEIVGPLLHSSNPTLGIYARYDGIHLRLTAKASEQEEAEKLIAQGEARLREIMADRIWGADSDTLEDVVGTLLTDKGLTIATMESCTGGLLSSALTDVPGSSTYYKGGFVAYSNEMKITLGVDAQLIAQFGAVSSEVAEAMAISARQRLGADIGVGITGVAGPDEVEGKPVGLVYIAICDSGEKQTVEMNFPPRRLEVKRRATVAALFTLRRRLVDSDRL
jgi:nicotinamide-nucleotide amidase